MFKFVKKNVSQIFSYQSHKSTPISNKWNSKLNNTFLCTGYRVQLLYQVFHHDGRIRQVLMVFMFCLSTYPKSQRFFFIHWNCLDQTAVLEIDIDIEIVITTTLTLLSGVQHYLVKRHYGTHVYCLFFILRAASLNTKQKSQKKTLRHQCNDAWHKLKGSTAHGDRYSRCGVPAGAHQFNKSEEISCMVGDGWIEMYIWT